MAELARKLSLSYQDYLEIERATDERHEHLQGVARPIHRGTPEHSQLRVELLCCVASGLRGQPGRVYNSDLKIHVPATGYTTYADLVVVCGPLVFSPEDPNAVTNPTLLAEVLSPSTEAWDRGGKFSEVQQLASLQHYVLVDPRRPRVEHYARQDDGSWRYTRHESGGVVRLLDIEIPIDALYQNLPDAVR